MTPQPAPKSKVSVVVIVLAVLGVALLTCGALGVLIAVPSFARYKLRSRQVDCKVALKVAYTAERAYQNEFNRYSENISEIQYHPDTQRAVLLFSEAGEPVGSSPDAEASAAAMRAAVKPLGITGHCPSCEITIACARNLDDDDARDVWSISTGDRTSATGQPIPAGQPHNDFDDIEDRPGK